MVARAIRNAIRANRSICANRFARKAPIFIARQADSHESLEFPIRANHPNRFARITPLRGEGPKHCLKEYWFFEGFRAHLPHKIKVKLCPPRCRPLKHTMNFADSWCLTNGGSERGWGRVAWRGVGEGLLGEGLGKGCLGRVWGRPNWGGVGEEMGKAPFWSIWVRQPYSGHS